MNWRWLTMQDMQPSELYAVLRLRQAVFVVEQNCPFLDCDGLDASALHLLGEKDDQLLAYLRLHAPGVRGPDAMLSRVVSDPGRRGEGLGRAVMAEGLAEARRRHPDATILIDAQSRLQRFYEGFEFVRCSAPFLEDGIEHVKMRRPA